MALNKILLSDGVTELANVKSVVFHEAVNADEDLRPGCVGSASITVEVFNTQANAVSAGDVVYCYQIDKNDNETLLGQFTCEPTIDTKNSYSFTAYDNAQKLNADFSQWLMGNQTAFPMTVYQLVSHACDVAGVTLGSSSWGLSTQSVGAFYADGITCRDILSYAAEIGCCFVRCHADGVIYFDWYSANAKTIGPTIGTNRYAYKQDGLTYANYATTALARVAVHPSGEDDIAYIYPAGVTSGNTLHIKNNLLLTGAEASFYEAVAQQVYTVMSSLGTYRPMIANLFAKENPFRAGDIVSVTDSQGVTFNSVVMDMSVSPSGAVLTSTGREVYGEYALEMAKQLVQLAADIVRINKLKVDWADIDTAIINVLQAQNITIGDPDQMHMEIDFNSLELFDKNGIRYTHIGDLRDESGEATIDEEFTGTGSQIRFTLQFSPYAVNSVTVNGVSTAYTISGSDIVINPAPASGAVIDVNYETRSASYHFDLGVRSGQIGANSLAAGNYNEASGINSSVSGGFRNVASDYGSHVGGGRENEATGALSVISGGDDNTASGGDSAIAGGLRNEAAGNFSFVGGGLGNEADGQTSSVFGGYNRATHQYQHVFGAYNELDPSASASTAKGTYIEIVGNGTASNARSNARTLDWDGNETLAGVLRRKTSAITIGTPPQSTQYPGEVLFTDSNNNIFAGLYGQYTTNDFLGMSIGPNRTVNGSTLYHWLNLLINENGSPYVSMSYPNAWRSALGLGTSGALPVTVAQGGSGQTGVESTAASSAATAAANFTITSGNYYQWGKVAQINITVRTTSAISASSSGTPVITMGVGKRPIAAIEIIDSTNNFLILTSSGEVLTYRSIAANVTFAIRATYLLP